MTTTVFIELRDKHDKVLVKKEMAMGHQITIGRDPAADLIATDEEISKRHVVITYNAKGNILATDLSTNGTYLNKFINRLAKNSPTYIKNQDILWLGVNKVYKLKVVASGSKEKRPKIKIANKKEGTKPGVDSPLGKSIIVSQNLNQQLLNLLETKTMVTIGRDASCDLVLPSLAVSLRHATIEKVSNNFFVNDLNSTNGTFVNRRRIHKKTIANQESIINIDKYEFKLSPAEVMASPVGSLAIRPAIVAKGLTQEVTTSGVLSLNLKKKKILNDVYLEIKQNEFVAIMGPSGCGKSTLLKALNGEFPAGQGSVTFFTSKGEADLLEHYDTIKSRIGYVPQDDIVHKKLKVYEALFYAAKLRLAKDASNKEIKERIQTVLKMLGIDEIETQLISGISGGQRKRVSIAVELLSDPDVLFLDEPTSPLDPQTIDEFLKFLKNLTRTQNVTIIMVTHKPEDLKAVDRVLFMGKGGLLTYLGAPGQVKAYFGKDIVGVYGILNDEERVNILASNYKRSIIYHVSPVPSRGKVVRSSDRLSLWNFVNQWYWLTQRYITLKFRDRMNLLVLYTVSVILSLLLGTSEWNKASEKHELTLFILVFLNVSIIWFGMFNAAGEIVSEMAIYKRERMYNLRLLPYVISKLIIIWLITLVQLVIFVYIVSLFASFHDQSKLLLVLSLVTLISVMIGLGISTIASSGEQVMTILPFIVIVQILFSGSNLKINNQLKETASWMMISRWGIQATATIQDSCAMYYVLETPQKNDNNVSQDQAASFNDKATNQDFCNICPPGTNGATKPSECYLNAKINGNQLRYYNEKSNNISLQKNLRNQVLMFILLFAGTIYFLKRKDKIKIKW